MEWANMELGIVYLYRQGQAAKGCLKQKKSRPKNGSAKMETKLDGHNVFFFGLVSSIGFGNKAVGNFLHFGLGILHQVFRKAIFS